MGVATDCSMVCGVRAHISGANLHLGRRDLRKLSDRQLRDRHDADNHRQDGDDHRDDGPRMKNFDITCLLSGFTTAPGRIWKRPSVTTRSPGFNPSSTIQFEPTRSPTFTGANRIVLLGSTTATRYVPCVSVTARCGTSSAPACTPIAARTLAYWPGRSVLPAIGKEPRQLDGTRRRIHLAIGE